MASVFFRGTRARPRWYARFLDPSGVWRAKRVRVETRADADKISRQLEAQAERRRYGLEAPEAAAAPMRELLKRWADSLTNRAAYDDRCRLRKWIIPRWGTKRVAEVTLPALMAWIDDATATSAPTAPTLRHCLTILSRIFGWAIERGPRDGEPAALAAVGQAAGAGAQEREAVGQLRRDGARSHGGARHAVRADVLRRQPRRPTQGRDLRPPDVRRRRARRGGDPRPVLLPRSAQGGPTRGRQGEVGARAGGCRRRARSLDRAAEAPTAPGPRISCSRAARGSSARSTSSTHGGRPRPPSV